MPNRKTDTNNNFAISTDFIGQNWDYPDADYETLKAEFSEAEQVNLTFAIGAINVWNRLAVGFRRVSGHFSDGGGQFRFTRI